MNTVSGLEKYLSHLPDMKIENLSERTTEVSFGNTLILDESMIRYINGAILANRLGRDIKIFPVVSSGDTISELTLENIRYHSTF